ncbi:O-antigen ligase family protein [Bacteroidetes bacterium endosymbiont of Geopemphigus sp.]|uniref:O-antigen ligase family protein n=1 Tax=Bacteroidetes bacterium endosymbiont of Geopemphigus sp. TaxID=2047937 RepID=UPI0018A7EB4A|nr:O-antigen ligase family protein [Bacteroidetes bacterium endosymbiont of Geopemphigus sp.]
MTCKNSSLWIGKISDVLFAMIPVSLLYDIHANSCNIAAFLIFYLLIERKVAHFKCVLPYKWLLIFCSLYLLEIFGIFYTKDFLFGFNLLGTSLTLILFPLFFPVYLKERGKEHLWKILSLFVANIFLISLWTFVKCLTGNTLLSPDHKYCFGYEIPYKYVYFGIYLNFSFWTVTYYLYIQGKKLHFVRKVTLAILSFLLLFFLYYSGGKAALLTWILTLILSLIFIVSDFRKQKIFKVISIGALFILTIGILAFQNPKLKNYFTEQWEKVYQNYSVVERIPLWRCAVEIFKEHPLLGTGLSNEVEILHNCYKKDPILKVVTNYNSHNSYLSVSVRFGLLGISSLLLMLLYPILWSLKHKYGLYTLFLGLFTFSNFSESMLERQIGLVFYSYFNIVLFSSYFFSRKVDD